MRFEGTLRTWNEDRGFGFIEPDQGEDQLFVHIKSMVNREGRPQVNQRFSFEVELGPQGKKRATKVLPAQVAKPIVKHRGESPAQWGTATPFAKNPRENSVSTRTCRRMAGRAARTAVSAA